MARRRRRNRRAGDQLVVLVDAVRMRIGKRRTRRAIERGHQGFEIVGVPQVVGVDRGDELTARFRHAAVARTGKTAIVLANDAQARLTGHRQRQRLVRAIIDQHDLIVAESLGEDRTQRALDPAGRVEIGDDDRHARHIVGHAQVPAPRAPGPDPSRRSVAHIYLVQQPIRARRHAGTWAKPSAERCRPAKVPVVLLKSSRGSARDRPESNPPVPGAGKTSQHSSQGSASGRGVQCRHWCGRTNRLPERSMLSGCPACSRRAARAPLSGSAGRRALGASGPLGTAIQRTANGAD